MNSIQQARYKAYGLALAHLKDHEELTKDLPAFQEAYRDAKALLDAIAAADNLRMEKTEGVTAGKRQFSERVANKALDISAALVSYATATNNQQLREAMRFTREELFHSSIAEQGARVANILSSAQALSGELKAYGITEETLNGFKADADQFLQMATQPRKQQAERKQAGLRIREGLNQLRDQLKNRLDKLMLQFRFTQPEFYQRYLEKRSVMGAGQRRTTLDGLVTDALSNAGIGAVEVLVNDTQLSTTTLEDGSFSLRIPLLPKAAVRFRKKGYAEATVEVELKRGQRTRRTVALKPE